MPTFNLERLRRYGLRVLCMRCGEESRHYPQSGRLRERACTCGGRLRARSWVLRYPDQARALRKAEGALDALGLVYRPGPRGDRRT